MAVSLPSDLIADVIRNADPIRSRAATARLEEAGTGFDSVVSRLEIRSPAAEVEDLPRTRDAGKVSGRMPLDGKDSGTASQGFEQMVLRSLFENMLPAEDSGIFGGGPAAGIWRSMAADELAGVYARAGGIGIASMVSAHDAGGALRRETQWPYFALRDIHAFTKAG